jgi:DNA primase large subunit
MNGANIMAAEQLQNDEMMSHLMGALNEGKDIGHYGRLVFIMGARHFMDEDELVSWLTKDKDCDERKARGLVEQVEARGYNPPKRERIMEWMGKQGFPICPNPDNPDSCNLYRNLEFPEEVYEHISSYREEKAEAEK